MCVHMDLNMFMFLNMYVYYYYRKERWITRLFVEIMDDISGYSKQLFHK